MDFAYDLLEKIQEEHTDYLLVTLRKGRQQYKVDVFYALKDDEAGGTMLAVIDEITKAIEEGEQQQSPPRGGEEDHYDEEDDEDDEEDNDEEDVGPEFT